jgi:hypothetical protein
VRSVRGRILKLTTLQHILQYLRMCSFAYASQYGFIPWCLDIGTNNVTFIFLRRIIKERKRKRGMKEREGKNRRNK